MGWMRIAAFFVCMATAAAEYVGFWQYVVDLEDLPNAHVDGWWLVAIASFVALVAAWLVARRLRFLFQLLLSWGLCGISFVCVAVTYANV